jgi:hypothetical protein
MSGIWNIHSKIPVFTSHIYSIYLQYIGYIHGIWQLYVFLIWVRVYMSEFIILISLGYRAFTELHHWMSCCWSSSNFQLQGTDRLSSMLTASTIPFCSFFPLNWRSGLQRTCLMSWICQTPAMSGAQQTWTIFLFTAWFQTDGAITCTPFNVLSLNRICIEELCRHSVSLSTWKHISSMAEMLRCVNQTICHDIPWIW